MDVRSVFCKVSDIVATVHLLAFNTLNGCQGSRLLTHVIPTSFLTLSQNSISEYLQIKFTSNNHPAPPVVSDVLNYLLFHSDLLKPPIRILLQFYVLFEWLSKRRLRKKKELSNY